jgi:hypothetical protein
LAGRTRFVSWPDLRGLTPAQREGVLKAADVERPRCALCIGTEAEPAKYAVFWDRQGGRPLCAWCAVGQWIIQQAEGRALSLRRGKRSGRRGRR